MPVINRVRLVNIMYDHKYISDKIIDFYDGSNTLLNLANGSGKSVIVQMLFQPIIPMTRLANRKVIDYLSNNSSPSYILIEWLLDNTKKPIYFLTGIAMSKTTSSSSDDDERSSVNYFTFTNRYERGNEFDIKNIPILKYENNHTTIFSYKSVNDKLKDYSHKSSTFNFYSKNNKNLYTEDLIKHQISIKEWEFLSKVNQKEGGLDELFFQCKSSDSLFEHWILKTISDSKSDNRSILINFIKELMMPIIENDENIKKKEFLESFAASLDEFHNQLNDFCNELDKKEKKEKELSGVYKYKKRIKEEMALKQENAQRIQDECKAELRHIELEKLSKEYYSLEDEQSLKNTEITEFKKIISKLELQKTTAEKDLNCMRAAKYFNFKKSAENSLNAVQNALKALENSEQEIKLRNLGYSIYNFYSAEIINAECELKKLSKELELIKTQIIQNETEKSENNNLKDKLIEQCTTLKALLNNFNDYEIEIENKIGTVPSRDMTGAFMEKSVEEISYSLSKAHTEALENSKAISARQNTVNYEIDSEKVREENLNKEIDVHKEQRINAQNELNKCNDAVKAIEGLLSRYEISSKYIFDKENNLSRLREIYSKLQSQNHKNLLEKERLSEMLEALKKGQLHTSRQFAKLLEDNGIDYQTGEEYLSAQNNTEYQEELLENNPLLPYCFIVNDTDFSKAIEFENSITTDRICPVISKSKIGEKLINKNREIIVNNLRLFSLYNYESISPKTRSGYAENLSLEIDRLTDIISSGNKNLSLTANDISAIESFSYTEQDLNTLASEVNNEKNKIEALEKEIKKCRKTQEELNSEKDKLKDRFRENEDCIKECKIKIDLYNEYLEKAKQDFKNRDEYSKSKSMLDKTNVKLKQLEDDSAELNTVKDTVINSQNKIELTKQKISIKVQNYSVYSSGELIENPIGEMEKEFAVLISTSTNEHNMLKAQCAEYQKTIYENAEILRNDFSKLSEDDYSNLSYSNADEKQLENICSLKEKELHNAENDLNFAEKALNQITDNLKKLSKKLKESGLDIPLSKNEISNRFDERIFNCEKRLNDARNDEKRLRVESDNISSQIYQIRDFISIDVAALSNIEEVSDEINIENEKEKYSNIKSGVENGRKKLMQCFNEMKGSYFGKNNDFADRSISFIQLDECEKYSDYYYNVFEPVSESLKHLNNDIHILKTKLEGVENDKKNIIWQTTKYAKDLYNEVKFISDSSKAVIQKENGRRKTLDIDIPEKLDNQAEERISIFVNNSITKMRDLTSNSEFNESDFLKQINDMFSDRQMFNAITGKTSVKVKVYKVQSDPRNSGLKPWESVYSGGEKFITCFILFSALMAYTRKSRHLGNTNNLKTVCLIDNPFGKTSSKHLLDAMLEIAKKFDTQLICLSALSESSITNNFDLIYQLSLKSAAYSSTSYLNIDNVINNSGAEINSHLDYVSLYNSQLSFL